jgi:hypothetical protein
MTSPRPKENQRAARLESIVLQGPAEITRFNRLMGQQHYLGATNPVGDFLRQVIVRNGEWVALLAWGSPCYAIKDRDQWIGWNRTQRVERLKLIAQNRRFLLLVERGAEPNLASAALAAATRTLAAHWRETFGYEPVLAETFTDPELYAGTCYKAAGWEAVGKSQGYRRHRADFYVANDRPKRLWLKPLMSSAREVLCAGVVPAAQQSGQTTAPTGTLPLKTGQLRSFLEVLQTVPDPRAGNAHFRIGSILAIVAMALMCGQRDISHIYRFGWRLTQPQRGLLGLPMKKGRKRFREVPGYKVYYEVLRRVNLDELARVLSEWLQARMGELPGALALDGKMVRDLVGTLSLVEHDTGAPVALAVISQKEGDGARCEMKAAQHHLQSLPVLNGRVVTGDALHMQRDTARAVVEQGGDYLLQVKGNQPALLRRAQRLSSVTSPLLPAIRKGTGGSNTVN